MTTLDELFTRSRRRTGARPADDAPKRTGDGARAPDGDDATLDGARAPDAPQRPGGPTAAPMPRPARPAATIAEARPAATDATPATTWPLLEDERTRIRRWLELIGETDPATIAKVLTMAAEDSTARHYYLERFRDWEERAAVAEFDGGLPRQEAERRAAAHPLEATEESRAALRAARQAFGDPSPRP
jgi:hypothetical protein